MFDVIVYNAIKLKTNDLTYIQLLYGFLNNNNY